MSPVLVVPSLGVPWSHSQADSSFQTCLVMKKVIHSVFIFKQVEGSLYAFAQGVHSSSNYKKTVKFIEQTITEVSTLSRIAPPPPPRVVAKRCHTNLIQLLPLVIPLTPERHQGLGWH